MSKRVTTTVADTPLLSEVQPVEIFATYAAGGSLRVERYRSEPAVRDAVGSVGVAADHIVIKLESDEGDRDDVVYFHQDNSGELEAINLAITALTAAREALAVGTVTA